MTVKSSTSISLSDTIAIIFQCKLVLPNNHIFVTSKLIMNSPLMLRIDLFVSLINLSNITNLEQPTNNKNSWAVSFNAAVNELTDANDKNLNQDKSLLDVRDKNKMTVSDNPSNLITKLLPKKSQCNIICINRV